jgi:hypothetical protein
MFSSKTAKGFYDAAIHATMPADVVEISAEYHAELLDGVSSGKVISWAGDGPPVLIERPAPNADELAAAERTWRDQRLAETDGIVARHRDEVEAGGPTTLNSEQYVDLQTYRRQLRDWPQGGDFPLSALRPAAPPWLASQVDQ